MITYALQTDSKNTSEYFHMDPADGVIYLKKSLDHETLSHHHFTVIASDKGVPSLSSTAHVWVSVMDMNDNPPKFEQPSYTCVLSEHATRGQFVTVVSASDPDYIDHDRLTYTIAQGNELQTYDINPVSGIITLVNMQNFAEKHVTILNVSVTDGVYTSFTRVKISILPANLHNPTFEHLFYDVKVNENQLAGRLVTTVSIEYYHLLESSESQNSDTSIEFIYIYHNVINTELCDFADTYHNRHAGITKELAPPEANIN